jgi:DNA-binding XRE family transcriptional regulator
MRDFERLRLQRLKARVTKRELAGALGCSEPWINQLENHGYKGPAAATWSVRYRDALAKIIAQKKASR